MNITRAQEAENPERAIGNFNRRVLAKDNPFAIHLVTELPFDFRETSFSDENEFWNHLQQANFRGTILGRRGMGKSTLLKAIHERLLSEGAAAKLLLMPREIASQRKFIDQFLCEGRSGSILLLDGIERVPFWSRIRLLSQSRSVAGFITTTHHRGVQRPLIRCYTSPDLLSKLLEDLGLDHPDIVSEATSLWPKYGGNLRMVLRELFDQTSTGKFNGKLPELVS